MPSIVKKDCKEQISVIHIRYEFQKILGIKIGLIEKVKISKQVIIVKKPIFFKCHVESNESVVKGNVSIDYIWYKAFGKCQKYEENITEF